MSVRKEEPTVCLAGVAAVVAVCLRCRSSCPVRVLTVCWALQHSTTPPRKPVKISNPSPTLPTLTSHQGHRNKCKDHVEVSGQAAWFGHCQHDQHNSICSSRNSSFFRWARNQLL